MANVAFIGLGKMGIGMASRMLDAGHQVSVYNRTAGKAQSVVSRGARLAGQAASPQVVRNVRRMVDGDHDRNVVFTAALRLKDVQYALRLAQTGSWYSSVLVCQSGPHPI